MKSNLLWKTLQNLGYLKVLIFQSDSIMIQHMDNKFLQYDYIGNII
jgi:hypothetical protein